MIEAEHALLQAVRDAIRTSTGLDDTAVRIEIDEQAPAGAGDKFIAVMPDGIRPGPSHNTNSGASDLLYSVAVMVAIRAPRKPRDRTRELAWNASGALSELMTKVDGVDFSYTVMNAANTILTNDYSSSYGFIEPLRVAGVDARPRVAPAEMFGASGELRAAIARTMRYTGARRITPR